MESIEIKPDVMVILCQRAEEVGKPITDVIDEMLRSLLLNGFGKPVILKCNKCKSEIDYEINYSQGYCDYCESVVFIDKE
ncbi:MAG: hypothetical protein K8I03_01010 [Ignavibacteria bacterium]|nr:hypothetical protein [Ignavibacteria bacterium]